MCALQKNQCSEFFPQTQAQAIPSNHISNTKKASCKLQDASIFLTAVLFAHAVLVERVANRQSCEPQWCGFHAQPSVWFLREQIQYEYEKCDTCITHGDAQWHFVCRLGMRLRTHFAVFQVGQHNHGPHENKAHAGNGGHNGEHMHHITIGIQQAHTYQQQLAIVNQAIVLYFFFL